MWPVPAARFRCAEHLQVRSPVGQPQEVWDGSNWVEVPRALEVLSEFVDSSRASEALDRLFARFPDRQEGLALIRSLSLLIEVGGLLQDDLPPSQEGAGVLAWERRYHTGMVADRVRVEAFVKAVRVLVRPGDVVVDAGTGCGVLALAAVAAGASRVYAIESRGVGEVAARVFQDNGVCDRVQLIRADVRSVVLPELCDVLITETIGANPFDEGILPIVAAVRRHLKPAARIIPARISLLAAPLEIPDEIVRVWLPRRADLGFWRDQYGFDLGALETRDEPAVTPAFVGHAREWMLTEAPLSIASVALAGAIPSCVEGAAVFPIARSGRVNAVALGFLIDVGGGELLCSWSSDANPTSWDVSLVRLDVPVSVRAGSQLQITVQQPASGWVPSIDVRPAGA